MPGVFVLTGSFGISSVRVRVSVYLTITATRLYLFSWHLETTYMEQRRSNVSERIFLFFPFQNGGSYWGVGLSHSDGRRATSTTVHRTTSCLSIADFSFYGNEACVWSTGGVKCYWNTVGMAPKSSLPAVWIAFPGSINLYKSRKGAHSLTSDWH